MKKSKTKKSVIGWISLVVALASAVGIYFIPDQQWWFLAVLVVNVVWSIIGGLPRTVSGGRLAICRFLIGGLFIFSSFTKGVDPLGTKYKMLDYFAAYHFEYLNEYALVLAVLMILAEFLVGICLVTNTFPKLATLGGALFMLAFTAVTLFDAIYDMVPDCGCFGTAVKMTNWQTFYKNLVIDAVLLPMVLNIRSLGNKRTLISQFVLGLVFAVLFTGFEIYNYRHLPVIDFMNWKVGRQMNAQEEGEQQIYLKYRNKETREEEVFLYPNYPWNDSVWLSQWEFVDRPGKDNSNYIGFNAYYQNDSIVTDSIVTEMILNTKDLLMFTSHDMSRITDKEWEKIKNITETASQLNYEVIWVAPYTPEEIAEYKKAHPYIYDYYYVDELEVKTIVRFNPGLIWLDDGLVVDKWSAIDFPQGEKLNELLRR